MLVEDWEQLIQKQWRASTLKLSIDTNGAMVLAEHLRTNATWASLQLFGDKSIKICDEGAAALAVALATNNTVTEIDLGFNDIGVVGAKALARALSVNRTVKIMSLFKNKIGDEGAVAIAGALHGNPCIVHIIMGTNKIGNEGAVALAGALERNSTMMKMDLSDNNIGDVGAKGLAYALTVNQSVKQINLSINKIGDEGAVSLAGAVQENSSMTSIRLDRNNIDAKGIVALAGAIRDNNAIKFVGLATSKFSLEGLLALAASIMTKKSECAIELSETYESADGDRKFLIERGIIYEGCESIVPTYKYPWGLNILAILDKYGKNGLQLVDLTVISSSNHDGSYCAVAAAMQNDVDKTLQCLRLWPERAGEVLQERYGSRLSVIKSGLLYDMIHAERKENAAQGTSSRSSTEAIEAAVAVASAIQSSAALSMVNIHLCGEGYAGKTMTRQALLCTLGCGTFGSFMLPTRLADIALEEGRTLGMVSEAVEFKGTSGTAARVMLHDYGGQLEFRANHAPHLSAANSVYVVVVPLWDKRPGHDRAYELEEIVAMYTQWLKFLYTVVPSVVADKPTQVASLKPPAVLPQCITVINFARLCPAAAVDKVRVGLMEVIDTFNAAPGNQRIHFIEQPIVLDANNPAEVRRLLAPVLKQAIEELSTSPIPIAPCLQTVLADKALNNEWSLFTTEAQLKGLIKDAIKSKHAPLRANIPNEATREKVLDTICEITQGMLESRRDIVVIPVLNKERISINHPNWLTNEILGSLFDPKVRPQLLLATAAQAGVDGSHLLSLVDINAAVKSKLDSMTRAKIDDSFIPKLLQHVGVCIPVIVEGGLVRAVAEGADASAVQHWFPAFSTIAMKATDGVVLPNADHIVARRFQLVDPKLCIFPPGYFSSLFVSIVGLHNTANSILIFQGGMELQTRLTSSLTVQIVVRQSQDLLSFVVTVATAGSEPGSDLAFQTIQDIKKFIYSESDWRGNVRVQECGLDPTDLKRSTAIPVDLLLKRLEDETLRTNNLIYYFGVEVNSKGVCRPHDIQSMNRKMDLILDILLKDCKIAVENSVRELKSDLSDLNKFSTQSLLGTTTALDQALCNADTAPTTSGDSLSAIVATMERTVTEHAANCKAADSASEWSTAALKGPFGALRASLQQPVLHQTVVLDETQLQHLKVAMLGEIAKVSEELHASLHSKMLESVAAEHKAAQAQCRTSLADELRALHTAVNEGGVETLAQIAALQQQLTRSERIPQQMYAELVHLRGCVDAVRSVQMDALYKVYDVPLLLSITQPAATSITGSLKRTLYQVYRLHFVCACCGKKAASGTDNRGYDLMVTKDWVARMSKVLRCTLLALQVLSLVTPVPLPHLADLAQYLPGDMGDLDLQGLLMDTKKAVSAAATVVDKVASAGSSSAVDSRLLRPAGEPTAAVDTRPVITLEHVTSVLEVLQMAGEAAPPAHPKHTGLTRAICSSKGQCAWVCQQGEDGKDSACKIRYMAEGNDCLAIQMMLG